VLKKDVQIGALYTAKISNKLTSVRISSVCSYGGWWGINLTTGRSVRIKSAAKLQPMPYTQLRCNHCGREFRNGEHPLVWAPMEEVGEPEDQQLVCYGCEHEL